jgi:hypothetical protein
MTNKPMLSVERELLERLAKIENIGSYVESGPSSDLCPACLNEGKWNWAMGMVVSVNPIAHDDDCPLNELRALLDKPARPVPECVGDLERFEADDGVFVRLGDVIDMLGNEKATQHQGEPVAWLGSGVPFLRREDAIEYASYKDKRVTALYAEQPAPVAMVMPEPYGLAMFKMLSGFDSVTPEQFNLVWTACRKEVARLNGVKQ